MASLYETTTTSENETKPASNKKRSKPWEKKEEITLIVEVINREQLLFGELKGPGSKSIQEKRADGLSEIVDILNSYVKYVYLNKLTTFAVCYQS